MEEKSSPHRSDTDLMADLEAREQLQAVTRRQQGKQLSYVVLGLIALGLAVFLSFRENRELVWALATGAPLPDHAPPVTSPKDSQPLMNPVDSQLAKEVMGFMHTQEPSKNDSPPPKPAGN